MKHLSFFILLSFFLIFSTDSVMADSQKSIEKAVYIAQSDSRGGVMLTMKETVLPSVSQLGGESPRIILDFNETIYLTPNKINVIEDPIVRSLRFGLHTEPLKTRVVIDLTGHCKIKKPTITEVDGGVFILLSCEGILSESKEKEILQGTSKKKPEEPTALVQEVKGTELTIVPKEISEKLPKQSSENQEDISEADKGTVKPSVIEDIAKKSLPQKISVTEEKAVDGEPTPAGGVKADVDKQELVDFLIPEPKEDIVVESVGNKIADAKQVQQVKPEEITPPETIGRIKNLQLFEISYNRIEEKDEELVLFYLNGFIPPNVSAVEEGKLQVVCEFEKVDLNKDVEKMIKTDGKYIKSITASEEISPQKVRIVIELSVDHDYDLQQIFYKNDNVFSLIISGQAIETP